MNREYGRGVLAVVVIALGAAIAFSTPVQAYDLHWANLGSSHSIFIAIPMSGNAQVTLPLQVGFSGGGANCTTGSLSTYWHGEKGKANHGRNPIGLSFDFNSSGIGIPAPAATTVAINVDSTAQPMRTRAWTIVVPRGTCGGSNQQATVYIGLTKNH